MTSLKLHEKGKVTWEVDFSNYTENQIQWILGQIDKDIGIIEEENNES